MSTARTAKSAAITREGLVLDGELFPWHIDTDLVVEHSYDSIPLTVLRIGIFVDGPVTSEGLQ
ncbi:hypothetical protein SEA_CEN1621_39 [Microbacterium phage Cen1621]|uniref:Uncharacterized protein n=1 Tax=Microbacterium phage Cen1621 TaxID=2965191 RepID=A0A9E7QC45_9CAUD|nr:hypothetical protein SEA_CEN1621_39 [Microbacterium phage Cen1621]